MLSSRLPVGRSAPASTTHKMVRRSHSSIITLVGLAGVSSLERVGSFVGAGGPLVSGARRSVLRLRGGQGFWGGGGPPGDPGGSGEAGALALVGPSVGPFGEVLMVFHGF